MTRCFVGDFEQEANKLEIFVNINVLPLYPTLISPVFGDLPLRINREADQCDVH